MSEQTAVTQKDMVRSHLLTGQPITRMYCLAKFGAINLPDIIWKLKKEGLKIESTTKHGIKKHPVTGNTVEKSWSEYRLVKKAV